MFIAYTHAIEQYLLYLVLYVNKFQLHFIEKEKDYKVLNQYIKYSYITNRKIFIALKL